MRLAPLLLFSMLVAPLAYGQEAANKSAPARDPVSEKRLEEFREISQKQDKQVGLRIAAIKAETAKLHGHPWAGEYWGGDGLGVNLRLFAAPKNGIAYQWHGCLGLYEQNIGTIKTDGPHLNVEWTFSVSRPLHDAKSYLPIRWGKHAFLVPPHEIIHFCEGGKSKWPSLGLFLQRQDQENRIVSGKPDLPKGYERYWTLGHISARTIAVRPAKFVATQQFPWSKPVKWKTYSQVVTLNVGSVDGVLPGMVFYSVDIDPRRSVTVQTVQREQSLALTTEQVPDGKLSAPLKPGIDFTTDFLGQLLGALENGNSP